jgi:hypothetical protein
MYRGAKSGGTAAKSFRFIGRCLIFLSNRGPTGLCGGFVEKNECKRRNPRAPARPANEVLAWHLTVPINEHKNSDMAGAEELLVARKAVPGAGGRARSHRHQCVLILGSGATKSPREDGSSPCWAFADHNDLLHGSFFRCERQIPRSQPHILDLPTVLCNLRLGEREPRLSRRTVSTTTHADTMNEFGVGASAAVGVPVGRAQLRL